MIFSRYPDTDFHLPVAPGAAQAQVSTTVEAAELQNPARPSNFITTTIVTKEYMISAAPLEIEAYYKANLPRFGWWLLSEQRLNTSGEQWKASTQAAGNVMYFRGIRNSTPEGKVRVTRLYVTVSTDPSGKTKVQLRAIVSEGKP